MEILIRKGRSSLVYVFIWFVGIWGCGVRIEGGRSVYKVSEN